MGKRVDQSGRAVISGDSHIDVDELGVPYSIARTLTMPITVTHLNKQELEGYVAAGPYAPHGVTGANYIVRPDGRIDLRMQLKEASKHLEIGYQVERHLKNGDVITFNRQPSLHKSSIMGERNI